MGAHRRLVTGIDGLDLVLDGGIRHPAQGSVFLVVLGGPGTGKTHLALETTVRALAQTEAAGSIHLYYGLDQSPAEIHAKLDEDFDYFGVFDQCRTFAGSVHGERLTAMVQQLSAGSDEFDRYLLFASLREDREESPRNPETLLELIDRDLDTITRASGLGDSITPRMVTIDNIPLSTFEQEDGRRHLRRIRNHLAHRGLHGIFVVETPDESHASNAYAATEYAADVIVHLGYHAFGDQFKERSIEISKARHQFYFRGTHHFSIVGRSDDALRGARGERDPGIHVYPSVPTLLSWLQYRQPKRAATHERLELGVPGLRVGAESSNGVIAPGDRAIQLHQLALRFLAESNDDHALLISFLEPGDGLLRRGRGWLDASRHDALKRIHPLSFDPEHLSSGKFLKDVHDAIGALRQRGTLRRVALVGLDHLRWGFPLLHDAKMLIPWLTVFFRYLGVTSLFAESADDEGSSTALSATVDNLFRVVTTPEGPHLRVARAQDLEHAGKLHSLVTEHAPKPS